MKIQKPEEIEAAMAFAAGEQSGFEYFFNKLYVPLVGFGMQKFLNLPDPEESAKDVVVDAFTITWRNRSMFSDYYVIKSFLYSCVKNACFNELKRSARFQNEIPDATYSPFNEQVKDEFYELMFDALERLPERRRQIIKMRYLLGKDVNSISSELNIDKSTVKTHLANGLWSLRKIFGVTSEMISSKRDRLFKRIFYSCTTNNTKKGRLYGYDKHSIYCIRNGSGYTGAT